MKHLSPSALLVVLGCGSAAIGVAAGAFGAHGLKDTLAPNLLAMYETAVRYQMYHAFGLLATGWVATRGPSRAALLAGWCFVFGTLVFCGSLYALTLSGLRWLGAITPFGGLAFIVGWLLLIVGMWQQEKE